jgi:hypothetical protein
LLGHHPGAIVDARCKTRSEKGCIEDRGVDRELQGVVEGAAMTTHALSHHHREESSYLRWIIVGFVTGALAVLVCHQTIAMLLYSMGITERTPYAMQATRPLGVPQLWSLAFWGGLWGVALAAALRRLDGAELVIVATLFGAILPTLVAWTVVASLKGQPLFAGGVPKAMAVGLLVNAAWGLGTGTGLAVFGRPLKIRAA